MKFFTKFRQPLRILLLFRSFRYAQSAEEEGFEPSIPCGIPVFETGALDQLCDSSVLIKLAFLGFFR
jgi:hypothetical protein